MDTMPRPRAGVSAAARLAQHGTRVGGVRGFDVVDLASGPCSALGGLVGGGMGGVHEGGVSGHLDGAVVGGAVAPQRSVRVEWSESGDHAVMRIGQVGSA